ncbi:MAG: hypothetical protein ABH804_03055 [archaeon]
MLKQTSVEFRKFFLLRFTKELIKNSSPGDIFKLEKIIRDESKEQKEKIKKEVQKEKQEEEQFKKSIASNLKKPLLLRKRISPPRRISQPVLRVPEPMLPQRLMYLKPVPGAEVEIEFDKLIPLLKDPMVFSIECNGPNIPIIVSGSMGIKNTNITLSEEEINEVIYEFSRLSRIPTHEGVYRVAVGKLIFIAVISSLVTSRFIIRKMRYNPLRINQGSQLR